MEERIVPLVFQGKEIIYFNFRGLTEDQDIIQHFHNARDYMLKLNRPTLQLTNVTGVYFTPNIMKNLDVLKAAEHLVIKDAVVGVTGVKKILFQIYNTMLQGKTKTFDDEEAAKQWLVSGESAEETRPSTSIVP